jgi:flagellar assembly protein FliH
MSFQPFAYRDPSKPAPAATVPGDRAQAYAEPNFELPKDAQAADSAHRRPGHFKLDREVESQLGIDTRIRDEQDAKLKTELERRWEKMSEQAEVEGYTKGLAEGKAEAYKAELPRINERIEKMDRILQEFDSAREKIFTANEVFVMELVARVAGMVALKEVELDKDYVRRVVMALLQQLGSRDDLKIFLSEADSENIDSLRQVMEKEYGKLTNTMIEVSAEIPVGGCKIETRFGVVDASVATQIENVMKALKTR